MSSLPLSYSPSPPSSHASQSESMISVLFAERLEIADKLKKTPVQLSGGQAQRVAIARALIHDPQVILADEPTGALDEATGTSIMELFSQINKENGTTLIVVTHDPGVAEYCGRTVTMKDGKIV